MQFEYAHIVQYQVFFKEEKKLHGFGSPCIQNIIIRGEAEEGKIRLRSFLMWLQFSYYVQNIGQISAKLVQRDQKWSKYAIN